MHAAHQSNWKEVRITKGTIFEIINNNFSQHSHCTPSFEGADSLIIGSDYSGESKDEPYWIYSFLITSNKELGSWEAERLKLRKEFLPDSRRMAYKNLSDYHRRKFLLPILEAADNLNGLSVSFAINKKCGSIFSRDPLDLTNPEFSEFIRLPKSTLYKAFTILHFVSFLLAGTASDGQNVFWFSDQDAIAANPSILTSLTKAFSWIASEYLPRTLGHMRCGTTACDNGSRQIEDFVAIPDLISGALSEQFRASLEQGITDDKILWLAGAGMRSKATPITFWLGTRQKLLRKHVIVINPLAGTTSHKVSWFNFASESEAT